MFPDLLVTNALGVLEGYLQVLRALHKQIRRYLDSMRDERVVGLEDLPAIELNSSEGVQTFKHERSLAVAGPEDIARYDEFSLIHPGLFSNPLHGTLILSKERVGDRVVSEQVEMYFCGKWPAWLP
jgi:hypothetical protein